MPAQSNAPTRALVLGGGGPAGVGWQTGLLAGLREAGVGLDQADVILGTSAGSVVGAQLATGRDLADVSTHLSAVGHHIGPDALAASAGVLLSAMEQAGRDSDPRRALAVIGRSAQSAGTLDEDAYLDLFGIFADTDWPAGFQCTAIDTDSGELAIWGTDSGVPLQRAVASSCSIPALFPPVTIAGRRFMDGGVLSHLNAAAVPATDLVLAISCFALSDQENGNGPRFRAVADIVNSELDHLRGGRQVMAIEPAFGDGMAPPKTVSPESVIQATETGLRQAAQAGPQVRAFWNP
ncbi:patatin-like phospholipase family protein [Streptomyces sp. NPDC048111]|uniref:patatin-like phospholipase family protein n=1 Tax=Streptomyces sp. NPDC048111 TaxID=3365500 RepID=UPI003722179D